MRISKVYEEDDHGIIEINSPKHGLFKFLIDKEDIERCSKINWSIVLTQQSKENWGKIYYAQGSKCKATKNKSVLLHRFIMNAPDGVQVDHIYHDQFDARKASLRFADYSSNQMNRRKAKNNTSGTVGVIQWNYGTGKGRWFAYIYRKDWGRSHKSLGYYDTYEEAVAARKAGEIKYFGEYRCDNANEI